MDDWKSTSERLQDVTRWKTPQQAERDRKKNGLVWLCLLLSAGAAGVLGSATGSGELFWLAWIVFSALSVGMTAKK